MEENTKITLESLYNVSEKDFTLKKNDLSYKTEVIKVIAQKCKNEDFEYYRKVNFKGKTEPEINQLLEKLQTQQVFCIQTMKKVYKNWIHNDIKKYSKSDELLIEAFKKTNEKTLVDRKIIDTLLGMAKNPNDKKIGKDLSLYVFGSQHIKKNEENAWISYDSKKNETQVESPVNYFNFFLGALLVLTVYMVFLRNNERKLAISSKNNDKVENNNENSTDDE